jgi:hypothetical protein
MEATVAVRIYARDTPEQNHKAEVAIATITNKAKTLLESANVPKEFRHKLFPFAAATAQKTDNLMIVKVNGTEKTRYEHFLENIPAFTKHMRTWGEAGVVKTKTKASPYVTQPSC